MNLPKHISEVPEFIEVPKKNGKTEQIRRIAVAPYNFVELPEQIVPAQQPLPKGYKYYDHLHTGRIECTLTTESPLYIRCGLTPEQFKEQEKKERKDLPEFFYLDPETKTPVLPGSSLRGMLRTLVEIASFSKIDRVSDQEKLFFRAVAASPQAESWGQEYKKYVVSNKVKAGYLRKDKQGWYIQPAKTIHNVTFAWVKEDSISLSGFTKFNDPNYEPQYIDISYEKVEVDNKDRAKRVFARKVTSKATYLTNQGVLVTSGNMKQGNTHSPRRNHCVIFPANESAPKLRLEQKVVNNYCSALTDFQKKSPFDKDWGFIIEHKPVFYSQNNRELVGFFGQSPNFRIPYSPDGNGNASTVTDFIPKNLKFPYVIDIAEAIFGWIRQENKEEKLPEELKQRSGRIFFSDAICQQSVNDDIWLTGDNDQCITPQILASPKPTTFQHYLVQTDVDKKNLKHYASKPNEETVIRGHKLYWHKSSNFDIKHPDPNNTSDSQITQIKPIKAGVTFTFDIHFENLTDVELGALLWVLDKAKGDYRLKLGMGKPLGMGAVTIESKLYLSDRTQRYTQLFDHNNWEIAETPRLSHDYINTFEKYILKHISEDDLPLPETKTKQDIKQLDEIPRIKMLLAMLTWNNHLDPGQTKYMELEDFKDRKVLPTPLQIMDWEDNRRLKNSLKVDTSDRSQQIKPKPTLKGDESKKSSKSQQDSNPDKPKWRR